jgi:hypothetical protein
MAPQAENRPGFTVKIIALWSVFLFGTIFHTQLGLIPLFHGLDVLAAHGHVATDISEISMILWLMLGFFMLPLVAIIALCFFNSRKFRVGHFWLTVFYSIMNLAHLVVDLIIQPIAWYQIALMAFLFVNGLILNVVAYQWVREVRWHRHHRLESVG